ncbi:MAG TPA: ABC transporter permease [Candidatus Binatia bacterium]|nr:ABC transporter permease [Candidatus Binatia bacterium]
MNLQVAVVIALRALLRNRERSLLTVLGIIIGVAAVIVTVAIGTGARGSIEASIAGLGSNVIVILPGSMTTNGANVGIGAASTLTVDDGLAIAHQVRHVAAVTPLVSLRTQVLSQYNNWQTNVVGVSPSWPFVRNWALSTGTFFNDEDVAVGSKVCVIGTTVARELFPAGEPIVGATITIGNVPFRVIGLLASRGHTFGTDQDDTIVIPYSSLLERLSTSANGPNVVSALMISIDAPQNIAAGIDAVSRLLRIRHRIAPPLTDDFSVRDLADVAKVMTSAGLTLQILLASIATVSLIVGGIGIMNIMLVSVTERTREIGLRMAVGAPAEAILLQFLVEAVVLSVLGGAIGVVLGVFFSAIAAVIGRFPFTFSLPTVALSLLFSAAIGIGFGYYPARKAAHLDPIVALHAE